MYVQRGWREPGEVSLINSEIADCHATWEGGAVWVDGGEVSLLGSKISSCTAKEVRVMIEIESSSAGVVTPSCLPAQRRAAQCTCKGAGVSLAR